MGPINKNKANKCTQEIIDLLCDRGGFDDWWYMLDDDIQDEIKTSIKRIINKRILNE